MFQHARQMGMVTERLSKPIDASAWDRSAQWSAAHAAAVRGCDGRRRGVRPVQRLALKLAEALGFDVIPFPYHDDLTI
jgi:hypothetical protein